MNVLEIKNNLVKISYDVNDNVALADFLIIEDTNNPYVAQVMNIKADSAGNFAIAKLLFTFNDEGILKNYDGSIPSLSASVAKLPSNELLDIIPADNPILIGKLAQKDIPLNVDKSILENNLLICSDKIENTSKLITNISNQIDEKVIVIDPDGQFDFDDKVVAGKDFKLPLNSEMIDFIYENDLEDVDPINKAVIQDVFIEVQNYIKTLPENFLPFDTFLNVVDSQYKETQIPELVLLKNKLLKYKELNIFAQDLKDVLSLSIAIEQNISPTIDLSLMPDNLKKEILLYIYSVLNNINEKIFVFAKTNNSNISKKVLKRYLTQDNANTVVICPHEFKYISEVKEVAQNIIFFAPQTVTHDFAGYNTYLSKLNYDEFVICGAHTQNIPFIAEIASLSDTKTEDNVEALNSEEDSDNFEFSENEESLQSDENEQPDDITTEEQFEEIEIVDNPENVEENKESEDNIEIVEDGLQSESEHNFEDKVVVETFDDYQQEPAEYENIIQEDIINENSVEETVDNNVEDNNDVIVDQVAKDVDRVFYEKLPDDEDEIIEGISENSSDEVSEVSPSEEELASDLSEDLTDEDLNLIDDLSSDEITLAGDEYEVSPPTEEEEQPPVVPIYPADDIKENEDPQAFEPGDKVATAKYGEGVVEKMIKYGNKMLCSIDFPSIGRRLLDPSMTEITKLES